MQRVQIGKQFRGYLFADQNILNITSALGTGTRKKDQVPMLFQKRKK